MCLAAPNVHLLALTSRKGTIEKNLAIDAMRKMQLTNEMTKLSRDYNSKLNQKAVVYYDNAKYNKINYNYLMGWYDREGQLMGMGDRPVKQNMSTILTDFRGQVVLSSDYVNAIMAVCPGVSYSNGQGGPFDKSLIPQILAAMFPRDTSLGAAQYEEGIQNYAYNVTYHNATSGEVTGTGNADGANLYNQKLQNIVAFYYPILLAAATNGWTTEYNDEMGQNENYLQDALSSGILCLASVDESGYYQEDTSLTYYSIAGEISFSTDSEKRETITAWYNAEKDRISEKESWLDIEIQDLSTELEAIKTEIDSVKKFVQEATESFNWGGG